MDDDDDDVCARAFTDGTSGSTVTDTVAAESGSATVASRMGVWKGGEGCLYERERERRQF